MLGAGVVMVGVVGAVKLLGTIYLHYVNCYYCHYDYRRGHKSNCPRLLSQYGKQLIFRCKKVQNVIFK